MNAEIGRTRGFTLIETIVVVAIITILAAIAYPSYIDRTMRANRVDAKTTLLAIAAEQEKFFLKNNKFAATLPALGITATENGYYTLAISNVTDGTFTVTATGASGELQQKDKECKTFAIDQLGHRTATGGDPVGATDKCWP